MPLKEPYAHFSIDPVGLAKGRGEPAHRPTGVCARSPFKRSGVDIGQDEPFSNEADRAYAQMRAIARMAHELQGIEEQLKTMYGTAADMMQPEMPVIVALAGHGGRAQARPDTRSLDAAEDAVVKSAPQRPPSKAKPQRKPTKEMASPPQRLSANDEKVLAHLKTVLDRRSWTALSQAAIAQGAGIPTGSVGLAMRRVVAAGAVREKGKGTYRLS